MTDVPERYNMAALLEANVAAGRADKVAIVCGDERLTYGALHARACAFGRALRALGVRREERVLLVLDDTPTFAVTFWGALLIGAVPVPINPLLRAEDYRFFAEDLSVRVVVIDPPHRAKLDRALQGMFDRPAVVVTGGDPMGVPLLTELLDAHAGDLAVSATHRDDIAFMLTSGGTTGRPKAIVHLHHDVVATCETYARHILGITENDIVFARLLFHSYGFGGGFSFPVWAGATSILQPGKPTPQSIMETVRKHRPSLLFLVPTLYNAIVNDPEAGKADLSSVRHCISAAEPLGPEVWSQWKERFGLEILDGIGSTEVLHIFCSNRPGAVRPGSSGMPVPGYDLRLLDETGLPVGIGVVGDLYVKGDATSPYYWRQHAKSQQTMQGGWVRTGDRFRQDADGYFWYEGRYDDVIKVRGEWVSPIAIEHVLCTHPAVHEAAVVGIPVDGVTMIKATVVLRAGTESTTALVRDLQEWCKERMQRYQFPQTIDFVDELPKTATGKIQRYRLREVVQ